ncbi:LysR family transcriptional regulator [Vreelandella sp. EE27]
MDTQDQRILCMLYEMGTIKAVSDALYITQPAISYRVKKLEEEFFIKILVRERRGVSFTPEGAYLVEYAKKSLEDLYIAKETLNSFSSEVQGTLRLGVANIFAHYKLPILLKSFQFLFPKVKVKLHTGLSPEIIDMLKNNKIDVGVENCGYNWSGEKEILCQEGICMISYEKIDFKNIHKYPLISTKRNHVLQQIINTWFRENYKQQPRAMMEVDFVDTCKTMVENGLGIAVVPSFCLRETDNLFVKNLTNSFGEPLFRNVFVNYKEGARKLPVVDNFLSHIRNHQYGSVNMSPDLLKR